MGFFDCDVMVVVMGRWGGGVCEYGLRGLAEGGVWIRNGKMELTSAGLWESRVSSLLPTFVWSRSLDFWSFDGCSLLLSGFLRLASALAVRTGGWSEQSIYIEERCVLFTVAVDE